MLGSGISADGSTAQVVFLSAESPPSWRTIDYNPEYAEGRQKPAFRQR